MLSESLFMFVSLPVYVRKKNKEHELSICCTFRLVFKNLKIIFENTKICWLFRNLFTCPLCLILPLFFRSEPKFFFFLKMQCDNSQHHFLSKAYPGKQLEHAGWLVVKRAHMLLAFYRPLTHFAIDSHVKINWNISKFFKGNTVCFFYNIASCCQ